jgi:hypothetical protein
MRNVILTVNDTFVSMRKGTAVACVKSNPVTAFDLRNRSKEISRFDIRACGLDAKPISSERGSK